MKETQNHSPEGQLILNCSKCDCSKKKKCCKKYKTKNHACKNCPKFD